MNNPNAHLSKSSLEEAADWLIRTQEAPLSATEQTQFEQWQQACTDNTKAWQRAQRLIGQVDSLPASMANAVLNRPDNEERRLAIGKIALLLLAGPTILGGYKAIEVQQWTADYRTAKGETKQISLPDGSLVKLNTATALDTRFDQEARLLILREGEIEIKTASADPQQFGPFMVQTRDGRLTPLGTHFTVRQCDEFTRLAVIEGRVQATLRLAKESLNHVINKGQQAQLSSYALFSNQPLAGETIAWLNQMLAVHEMPLQEFILEVARYRHGLLRVSDSVAQLKISGAFPTTDTDVILNMLSHTYPIHITRHLGGYWTNLEAS